MITLDQGRGLNVELNCKSVWNLLSWSMRRLYNIKSFLLYVIHIFLHFLFVLLLHACVVPGGLYNGAIAVGNVKRIFPFSPESTVTYEI